MIAGTKHLIAKCRVLSRWRCCFGSKANAL